MIAFDYNYNDTEIPSWMSIGGESNLDSRTKLGTATSDAAYWNINVKSAAFGAGVGDSSISAALASQFPFIAVPSSLFSSF